MRHLSRRPSSRPILGLIGGLVLAGCAGGDAGSDSGEPEILWDRYGVPHVFAGDDQTMMYAWGWAQMRNHADLILRLYARARGEAAEHFGRDRITADRWTHTVEIPDLAAAWYAALEPDFKPLYDAFVDGMNAYAAAHPETIDAEVASVLPVRPEDPMAQTLAAVHYTFIVSAPEIDARVERWSERVAAVGSGTTLAAAGTPDVFGAGPVAGSNAWAIAPSRSASGNAMLLANPHLPWEDLFVWVEGHLSSPSLNVSGATLVGLPLPMIALNKRLGWTFTVNTFDGADLYELELADDGYRWDGDVRPFETREVEIRVRTETGGQTTETLEVRESVHGPVVGVAGDRALALRVVGTDQPHVFEQAWDMLRARDLEGFESAFRRLQIPMFNMVYADADGHILYVFGGRTPVRPAGPYDWSGIVAGTGSETLWMETHPYEDLPRLLDPPSGFVQNANDPPWTATFPVALDPEAYPGYLAPQGMPFRPQRSARMLVEDESVTYEELVEYKHSTRMELADRVLDDLLPAAQAAGGEAAAAAAILEGWDRTADAESRGGVLFTRWWDRFVRAASGTRTGPFATPWSADAPRTTPDGLGDSALAVEELVQAARDAEQAFGSADAAWGDAYRIRRDGVDQPANGGPGQYGVFRVVGFRQDENGTPVAAGGDSYYYAAEFGPETRVRSVLVYGNASQAGSPHRVDQIELFTSKTMKPIWWTEADVRANMGWAETLPPRH